MGCLRSANGEVLGVGVGQVRAALLVGDHSGGNPVIIPAYSLFVVLILGFENSHRYGQAVAVAVVAAVVVQASATLYGRRWLRPVERWAAGETIDRAAALEGTYVYVRKVIPRIIRVQRCGMRPWAGRWDSSPEHPQCESCNTPFSVHASECADL